MSRLRGLACMALVAAFSVACSSEEPADGESASGEDEFSSDVATLLDFDFDGELTTTNATNPKGQIRAQLMYTVGHLNGDNSVAWLPRAVLTNITTASAGQGLTRIRYHAKMPVAWGAKKNLPTSYEFRLPKRVDQVGQDSFLQRYGSSCNEGDAHAVSASNYWYHYRPRAAGCSLDAADLSVSKATLKVSTKNTSTKYPEYHRVWEDGSLNVVAVFGKYEEGATGNDDAGIEAYNAFLHAVRAELPNVAVTPADLGDPAGAERPDVTLEGQLDDGRVVTVSALLIDRVSTAPVTFDKRYSELVAGADLIFYGGHAGLGSNIAALAQKGNYFPGKYQMLFLNGCDTFAYQDDTLATRRAALNPDDLPGTKYLDIMANALPAYFSSMPDAGMALLRALIAAPKQPLSYNQIFKKIDPVQVVVVTGEEDNVFTPQTSTAKPWAGTTESGTVAYKESRSFETDVLPAGKYVFALTPEPSAPGGDADLRVRVGSAPNAAPDKTHKCQSYVGNSNERCLVTVSSPSKVYFSVTGDKSSQPSSFILRAYAQ